MNPLRFLRITASEMRRRLTVWWYGRSLPGPRCPGNDATEWLVAVPANSGDAQRPSVELIFHGGMPPRIRPPANSARLAMRSIGSDPAALLAALRDVVARSPGAVVVILDASCSPRADIVERMTHDHALQEPRLFVVGRNAPIDLRRHPRPHVHANSPCVSFRPDAALLRRIDAVLDPGTAEPQRFSSIGALQSELARVAIELGAYVVPREGILEGPDPDAAPVSRENPLVTVFVPARDAAETIERAVASALAQDYRPLEVCVCDDGSTDATVAKLQELSRDPRVRWVSIPPRGIAAATNAAIGIGCGEFLLQLDADDELLPGAARMLAAALAADPDRSLVYGTYEAVDVASGRSWTKSPEPYRRIVHLWRNIVRPPRMFRSRDFHRVGGCDEQLTSAVDYDLSLKLSEAGEVLALEAITYRYHMYPHGTSLGKPEEQERNRRQAVAAALARRGLEWEILPDRVLRPIELRFRYGSSGTFPRRSRKR